MKVLVQSLSEAMVAARVPPEPLENSTKRAASDADLVEMPGEAGQLIARGYRPNDVGRALGTARPAGLPANEGHPGTRPKRVRVP